MKKRILALALVGTTAFSVFGAAMSANAANVYWSGTSSHIGAYDGAYYQSYTPAGDITWDLRVTDEQYTTVDTAMYFAGTEAEFNRLTAATDGDKLVDSADVYKIPGSTNYTGKAYESYITDYTKAPSYYTSVNAFAWKIGYSAYEAGANGVVDNSSTGPIVAVNKTTGKYYMFDREVWETYYGSNSGHYQEIYVNETTPAGLYFLKNGTSIPDMEDYKDNNGNGGVEVLTLEQAIQEHDGYFIVNDSTNGVFTNMYTVAANTAKVQTRAYDSDNYVSVDAGAGYTTLDAVDPTDIDAVLEETVYPTGVIYLYDYYDNINSSLDADEIADAWAKGTFAQLMSESNNDVLNGVISPVTSYRGRGVREEVMYEWEDFLDELGISDASNAGLTRWAEDILENYAYTYYNADVIASVEWTNNGWDISFGTSVNLYNFDQLIEDIMDLAPANEAENAQTSELIYLMQQYHKYVDEGFVTVNPVENDDWGDLLVALAQAPTEDDFRTSAAYRRYTNAVEDLVEQYEEAETSVAVAMAEEDLYDFVTRYNSAYTVSKKADTAVLATSIDNTYFNTNWAKVGEEYAKEDDDGVLSSDYESISEYSHAWALYPKTDYAGSNYGAYPGVDNTQGIEGSYGVNDSYYWFYNVYTLAYNVYTSNKYQSVVDLMASTLDEAVSSLTPTTNAYASGVLAAEEQADKLADLIDTDYTAAMWANREKAYTHVTERVSNDEIGRQGSVIAADVAEETADYMGYQKFQTTVTRSDINSVSSAKASAEAALTALRNDTENYNAAQATALQNAIDDCDYIIDIYNGAYSKSKNTQSVNGDYSAATGDKDQILKSDITDAVQAVDDAINFSSIIMGWSQDKDGNWMYGVKDTYSDTYNTPDTETGPHYLKNGWAKIGKTWFYFESTGIAVQSDWRQIDGNWYYFNSNCGAATGWAKVDGDWYYFEPNNAMTTGWKRVDGCYYYMNASGKMVTGWCQIDGTWYYFSKESNALGQMLANTTTPDGYKVDANGALVD